MNVLMVILRMIHILAGIFWAGATFFLVSLIVPSVAATGPEGQKFMQHLSLRSQMTREMFVTATLTALSGLVMYFYLFGLDANTLNSTYSLALGLAGLAGLAAWGVGYFVQNNSIQKMKAISQQVEASGGPPQPEQVAQMQDLAARVSLGSRITAVLLLIAVIGMSSAQYLQSIF